MPPSSDESETIDVGLESSENPFGDMNVDEIPIEIVDDLLDTTNDLHVTRVNNNTTQLIYRLLNDDDRHIAALHFNLVTHSDTHPVKHYGVDKLLKSPSTVYHYCLQVTIHTTLL